MASSHTCAALRGSLDLHLLVSPGMQQLVSIPRPMIIMQCVLSVCYNATMFQSVLFLSVTCVPLAHETPPTALILDAPSGVPLPLLPQEPSPPADGVTLKAPQVGTPPPVLFLDPWFSECDTPCSPPPPSSIRLTLGLVWGVPTLLHPRLWSGASNLFFPS